MSFIFRSKRTSFDRNNESLIELVTSRMAMNIDIALKTTAGMPVRDGHMKAATRHFKNERGQYRVEINKEYAAVQEAGRRRGTRPFTNYTTPGTNKGFFKRAIDQTRRNRAQYINEARRALGI